MAAMSNYETVSSLGPALWEAQAGAKATKKVKSDADGRDSRCSVMPVAKLQKRSVEVRYFASRARDRRGEITPFAPVPAALIVEHSAFAPGFAKSNVECSTFDWALVRVEC